MPLVLYQGCGNREVSAIDVVDHHRDEQQKQRRCETGASASFNLGAFHESPAGFSPAISILTSDSLRGSG